MPASSPVPSLSQIKAWDTAHLTTAADHWSATANTWESVFSRVSDQMAAPGGTPWVGEAAEAAQERAYADRLKVIGVADQLHNSASAARGAARELEAAKQRVLSAIQDARAAGFTVGEDLSVTYPGGVGSAAAFAARQSQAVGFATEIRERAGTLAALDQQAAGKIAAAGGGVSALGFDEKPGDGGGADDRTTRPLDVREGAEPPPPPQPGSSADPRDWAVGDERFGHWEDVPPPPPYVGQPPPLKPEYRPYPDGTPLKDGPSTGMYTPGKSWIGDIDPPAMQYDEAYKFRLAGTEATTTTRMVNENGHWQQQRWVQNVYESQRSTRFSVGGDIGLRPLDPGGESDLGGLPPIQNLNQDWKPISLPEIAVLSAKNMDTTYYLPDGCGGTVNFEGGVPVTGAHTPKIPVIVRGN